jgi:hypothetical protein
VLLAPLIAAYSCSGYVMLGSFSVSNPEHLASYQRAAWVYLALIAASGVAALGGIVWLVRHARANSSSRAV